ncbi:DUF4376 domain-containing protein [Vreelandella zhanjiangensis]|uniref:DUF4376 domain-containing protein n=1 Tax=Vreelandella zhanjiangensis TaxID=1121960 RepID=UPI00402AD2B4
MSWLNDAEVTTKENRESVKRAKLLSRLESDRKDAEATDVLVDGVPYSGNPDNRAALLESVQFAREAGIETFEKWKDSSGGFHANYPVANVEEGLRAVANRRSKLIAREGEYAEQIKAGELTSIAGLDWSVIP